MNTRTFAAACAFGLLSLAPVLNTSAATLTYDFSGTAGTQPAGPPAWTNFRTTGNGTGTLFNQTGSTYSNTMSVAASATTPNGQVLDYGGFTLADRLAGTNFSITTSMTSSLTGSATWNAQAGIRALASSVDAEGGAGDTWYQLIIYSANSPGSTFGRIALEKRSGGVTTTLFQSSAIATGISGLGLNSGGTFSLSLTGTYDVGGALTLAATVSNGAASYTNSFVDATPLAGSVFGVRDRLRNFSGGTASLATNFDNYSVNYTAVPEPGSLVLAGLGLGVICLRRRRSVRLS